MDSAMKSSVFKKIFNRILISFIALTIALWGLSFYNVKKILTEELINSGQALSHSIADAAAMEMATMDLSMFQDLINNYTDIEAINYIFITNENNELMLDTFSPQPPQIIIDTINKKTTNSQHTLPELSAIQISHPILFGSLGHIHIGMNTQIITDHLMTALPQIFIAIPIIMALCLWLLYRVIKTVTSPLKTLSNFTKDIERYQFDISKTNQTDIKQIANLNDEIGTFTKNYLSLYEELENHIKKLTETSAKNSAIKKELSIAHDIQMNLLDETPTTQFSDSLSFSAYLNPAKDVGGDFYDVIEKNDTVFVTIGDVSGKGVSAALVMAATLTSIRTTVNYLSDPTDIITTVNQQISKHNPNMMFITLFFAAINTTTGIIEYVNAGHPSPLVCSNSITALPSTNSPVLGIDEHNYYPSNQSQLPPNSVLVMITDGVNEAHNKNNELFGDKAIETTIAQLSSPSAEDCTNALKVAIEAFTKDTPPHDDITILSVKYTSAQTDIPNPLIISFKNDINELIKLQQVTSIFSKHHAIEDKIEKSINLVMEELLSNTIFYGYKDNNAHTIYVKFTHEANKVTIHVEDDAIPFNPLSDAPEVDTEAPLEDRPIGGLGVHIVKKMVDAIDYTRENEKNKLTIIKELS
ncbi:hypothetical protein DID73_00575 [Candidatus Marinamargulisbacteria bacterium SCGC AG-343-K17]|nr:hypothetical protein DID73_00575 [Candidatus Marinamargulisbacteria bacterium SCGC AG-343-K17]